MDKVRHLGIVMQSAVF